MKLISHGFIDGIPHLGAVHPCVNPVAVIWINLDFKGRKILCQFFEPGERVNGHGGTPFSGGGVFSESAECRDTCEVASDDQSLHGIGAFIGGDHLHIGEVAGNVILQQETIACE